MRARSATDDRVADAAQRRLEALVAELGGHGHRVVDGEPEAPDDRADPAVVLEAVDAPEAGEEGGDAAERTGVREDAVDPGRHLRRPLPGPQRAASWAADRVPAPLAGLRVEPRHLAVLGALLVTGLVLAGCAYLRATSDGDPAGDVVAPRASGGVLVGSATPAQQAVGTDAPGAGARGMGPGTGPATGAASPGAPESPGSSGSSGPQLVVDVEGKVRRPGIAVLPAGSRVVDALEAAGGARPRADLRTLNLARLLIDGEQLLVDVAPAKGVAAGALTGPPAAGATGGSGATGATTPALVDLNTADQATLETLPGVGPVTAVAILQWRTEHGAFTAVDELLEVSGIGDATLAEIAPHVTV